MYWTSKVWRMNVEALFDSGFVSYGTAAASFVATKCLIHLSTECSELIARFFVDDLLTGSYSIAELIPMSKNYSNSFKWLFSFSKLDIECLFHFGSNTAINFFRPPIFFWSVRSHENSYIHWQQQSNFLIFSITSTTIPMTVTERSGLSGIARVFDPLGLLSPATVKTKILIQQLWLDRLGWAKSVILHTYMDWLTFSQLNNLKICRRVTAQI